MGLFLNIRDAVRLTLTGLVSRTLLAGVLAFTAVCPAAGHEIRPSIADVEVDAAELRMTVRLALESLVAGIDLQGLSDTNEAPEAAEYDRLRALPPAELEQALRAAWPEIAPRFDIRAGAAVLVPEIVSVEIPPVGDTALARDSTLGLRVALPPDGSPATIGWPAAFGPLVLRQQSERADAYTAYLTDGAVSDPLPREGVALQSFGAAFFTYMALGVEHIVPKGLDHILFVLGLFFFSANLRPLLLQITAFTVAHTVTLALATLDVIAVDPAIVEPLIALSIAYVAVENILWQRLTPWRTAVVFGFGLLHGLGFASVLGEIGLDPARLVTGLIAFNIGVELGQLSVIAAAMLLVGLWFRHKPWYRAVIAIPVSVAIAIVGLWWFVERAFLA
jgi:hypothetical protein